MPHSNSAIPPSMLDDRILLKEYRDLPKFSAMAHDAAANNQLPWAPMRFSPTGKAHNLFFLNKGDFLHERFDAIANELWARGISTKCIDYHRHPEGWHGQHIPNQEELGMCTDYLVGQAHIHSVKFSSYVNYGKLSKAFELRLIHGFGAVQKCHRRLYIYCRACGKENPQHDDHFYEPYFCGECNTDLFK